MASPRPRSGSSVVLLVVVLVALGVGAAASFVAGAATAPAFRSGPYDEVTISTALFDAALLSVLALGVALAVYARWHGSRNAIAGRFLAFGLAVLLVGVAFVVLLQLLGSGNGFLLPSSSGAPSSSSGSGNSTGGSSLNGSGGVLTPFHLPPWTLFVVVAVVVCVAAAVAIPGLWARSARRGAGVAGRRRPSTEAATALATAARALEEGDDPRGVIVRLYGALLQRIDPMVGGVDLDTPEEIRERHLVRLGIRPPAADTLTRLFEEARYSSHPIGPESAAEARAAIDAARADLDRAAPSP